MLPDVLAHGLDIVFCGTAAGLRSAACGAYYAGPGNAFWPTLFAVGLTPRVLRPQEYAEVVRWRLGLTDLAKCTAGADSSLARHHFDAARLHSRIVRYRPHLVAFTGKRAAVEFLGHAVDYGLLAERAGSTRLFVLPSPSGASRRYWDLGYWHQLADLRRADASSRGGPFAGDAGRARAVAGTIAALPRRL